MPDPKLYEEFEVIDVVDHFGIVVRLPVCCIHPFKMVEGRDQKPVAWLIGYTHDAPVLKPIGEPPMLFPQDSLFVSEQEYNRLCEIAHDFKQNPDKYFKNKKGSTTMPSSEEIIKELKSKVVQQQKIIDLLTEENNSLKEKLAGIMAERP